MRIVLMMLVICLCGCVSQSTNPANKAVNYDDAAKKRISLGLTYLRNGNYSQAKQNLDAAIEFAPRMANAHYSLAYYFQVVGEVDKATEYYEDAIRLDSKDADIANSYGAFLCQQNQYKQAKKYFLRAVNSTQYANSAQTYENMAICALKEGYTDDAIEYLRSALNHQPGRMQSLVLLTDLYAKSGNFAGAEETLDTIERYGRIDPDVLWLRMDVARQQGKFQQAKDYGIMLLTVYPESNLAKQYAANPIQIKKPSAKIRQKSAEVTQSNKIATYSSSKPLPKSSSTGASNTKSNTPSTTPPTSSQSASSNYHLVKRGENLFRISVFYNISMQRLIEWNELNDSGDIKVDSKLWLVPPSLR